MGVLLRAWVVLAVVASSGCSEGGVGDPITCIDRLNISIERKNEAAFAEGTYVVSLATESGAKVSRCQDNFCSTTSFDFRVAADRRRAVLDVFWTPRWITLSLEHGGRKLGYWQVEPIYEPTENGCRVAHLTLTAL